MGGPRRSNPSLLTPPSPPSLQGSWKQISKYYTPSRTPTQVASHAQKHFLRLRKAPRHARAAAAAAPSGSLAPAPAPAASAGAPSSSSGASLHLPSAFVRCAAAPAPLPAPDAAGVTVGIPMLLSQPGAPPPPPPGPGGAQMLRVIPGRISAPVSYVSAPEAPRGGAAKRRLAASPPPPPPRAARAATLRSLDALRGQLRGRCGAPASPSGSALSESSRAHAALDALAGVAAALADSAAWP